MKGLCGNFDESTEGDLVTSKGIPTSDVDEFVNSWTLTPPEEVATCHNNTMHKDYLDACRYDIRAEKRAKDVCERLRSGEFVETKESSAFSSWI